MKEYIDYKSIGDPIFRSIKGYNIQLNEVIFMDNVNGKITILRDNLKYGFIDTLRKKMIFFNEDSLDDNTSFNDIKIDQKVSINIVKTSRGLMAKCIKIL